MQDDKIDKLLNTAPVVINIGLESFADDLQAQEVESISVDWAPPAGGDPVLAGLLSKLGS
jgi:FdrA protein